MENEYQPRFVRVGNVGFDTEKVTRFYRDLGGNVEIYFSANNSITFEGTAADLVWNYLCSISKDLEETE